MKKEHNDILAEIRQIIESGRSSAYSAANSALVMTYWHIGKLIAGLNGEDRAEYGKGIIADFAKELTKEFGAAFSERNLYYSRKFYLYFPEINILNTCVQNLTWSHFRALLRVADSEARLWYLNEAFRNSWSCRALERNISTQYYYRLLQSPKKDAVISEMQNKTSQFAKTGTEIIKSPIIAEFLGYKREDSYLETDLEKAIISHLRDFLIEMGRGVRICSKAAAYNNRG